MEPCDGDLNDPVVTPLEHRMCHPISKPHGPLHHLDRPSHFDTRAGPSGTQLEARFSLEIAVYLRLDPAWWLASSELYLNAHPIRERRSNHTVKNGSVLQ